MSENVPDVQNEYSEWGNSGWGGGLRWRSVRISGWCGRSCIGIVCAGSWGLKFDVGWFEAVDGDCVVATVEIKGEMFVSSFDNAEWSVVRWLEWFPNSIMANKHMCG